MAFWGIEVKPGKPVTHSFDKVRQRLRISQATLGIGSAAKKTLVQCNVGNKHPVFLCALLPDKTESCHLELELEEADDVVFSVIGPRSVYLTGYYVSNSQSRSINSDTESYGEDIANSETEESVQHTDEDEYEDSFIDDDAPVVCPPSPVSSDGVDEKMLDKQNKKERKDTRKLQRKKFRVMDSDDDTTSQESGESDNFLLSVFKSKKTTKSAVSEIGEKIDQGALRTSENKADCGISGCVTNDKADEAAVMPREPERKNLQSNLLFPSDEVEPEKEIGPKERRKELFEETKALEDNVVSHSNDFIDDEAQRKNAKTENLSADLLARNADTSRKSKRKRKERSDEVKSFGSSCGNHRKALKEDKSLQAEAEADSRVDQDCLQQNIDNHKPTINGNSNHHSSSQPPCEVSAEGGQNSKKRRKEASIKETSVRSNDETHSNALVDDHVNAIEDGKTNKDLPTTTGQDKLFIADRTTNFDLVAESSESKRTKKKKKKSKSQENVSILSEHEFRKSSMQCEEGNFDTMSSQVRTLSNGLTIEELVSGEKDGKMAALGRKVKVFYSAMLKKDGLVFDSNIGKTPYKFRLGDEEIIQGWSVGLEGMWVGDKRRLIIPPSMGYGSEGAGENIPPNSWLVYDVDLVGVR